MARDDVAGHNPFRADDHATLIVAAHNVLAARRALQSELPADLVQNPALELLIALFVDEGDVVAEVEVLRAASVSPAVASRWIAALTAEQLVVRHDERVALTETGRDRVAEALRAMIRSQAALPSA